ncbi:Sensor histidine kinase TmoS [Phycisphaerae bacterium RAS1]|nr:Sensor histidine kinase TmoS [Phycisphaerae bacterium RAS1]
MSVSAELSEQLLRLTLDALPVYLLLLDAAGGIIFANAAWTRFTRAVGLCTPHAGVGEDYFALCETLPGCDARAFRTAAASIRDVLHGRRESCSSEFSCETGEGRSWYELHARRVETKGRPLLVVTHLDITARKQAKENAIRQHAELAHIARVATAGEIMAGVAHELNQPLTAISNYAQGCVTRLRDGVAAGELTGALSQIMRLAQKSGDIIRRTRNMARKSPPRRSTLNVNDLVHEVLQILHHELVAHGVTVHIQLAEDLPSVFGDAVQVHQVLTNLVLNAIAAVKQMDHAQRELHVTSHARRRSVEVSVIDSGPGFAETPDKLFEPFHTTKPDGLGMGLTISRSIVEAHGGTMRAERAADRTAFRFWLPIQGGAAGV